MQDYYNELAQLRAGKSSKSKMLLAKFKTRKSLNEWEVRKGNYFGNSSFTPQYDEGIDAEFDFNDEKEAVFSGFSSLLFVCTVKKCSLLLTTTVDHKLRYCKNLDVVLSTHQNNLTRILLSFYLV